MNARLRHDVGKYIARAATNVGTAPVAPGVLRMLIDDLYGGAAQPRASERFHALAPPEIRSQLTAAFAEIDRLESDVRLAVPTAVQRVAALACEIRDTLRRPTQ
jgi:hypothetical protein